MCAIDQRERNFYLQVNEAANQFVAVSRNRRQLKLKLSLSKKKLRHLLTFLLKRFANLIEIH